MTPDEAREVIHALANSQAIITHAKCWACLLGQCPGGIHTWADSEDVDHAIAKGDPDPSNQQCGCRCTAEPPYPEPEPQAQELDELTGRGPCPVCGEAGACAYDAEGRALIHADDETDEDLTTGEAT